MHKANINSIKVKIDKLSIVVGDFIITFPENDRWHTSKIRMHVKHYIQQIGK